VGRPEQTGQADWLYSNDPGKEGGKKKRGPSAMTWEQEHSQEEGGVKEEGGKRKKGTKILETKGK